MARALERRGAEVAAALFKDVPPPAPVATGDRLLAASPDEGRMYPHKAERGADRMTIRVSRCPPKEASLGDGLPPERIATLCRIAGAFDKGLFEAAGLAYSNEPWSEERGGGYCWITPEKPSATGP